MSKAPQLSFLAGPTEETAAPALNDALYGGGTNWAGYALSAVDIKAMLEISKLPVRVGKIP